jgi:hypothetical protein
VIKLILKGQCVKTKYCDVNFETQYLFHKTTDWFGWFGLEILQNGHFTINIFWIYIYTDNLTIIKYLWILIVSFPFPK